MTDQTVNILGFPVTRMGMREVLETIEEKIHKNEGKTFHIVTANAEILYRAYADQSLGALLHQADLITPDGQGAVKASQKLGAPVKERVTGIALTLALLPLAAQLGWRVYLLGAAPETLAKAREVILKDHPGLVLVGARHGYQSQEALAETIEEIRSGEVDLLLVAMGFPSQDLLIRRIMDQPDKGPKVAMGIGGSFDVISGQLAWAPKWIQKLGLEWAYRLLQNPKRFKRALALPRFVLAVKSQVRREKKTLPNRDDPVGRGLDE